MAPTFDTSGSATDQRRTRRYRLPGIAREGIAQLSLLETALWPLDAGSVTGHLYQSRYRLPSTAGKEYAEVSVRAPLSLSSTDEFILWGLLARTLRRPDNSQPELLATPYWMLKQLGMQTGGSQYTQLRDTLGRLAAVSYHNDAFYHPIAKEFQWVTFSFFSVWLPTTDRGAAVDTERLWRIAWNPTFYEMAKATGGNLLFDLDLFRSLSPAARRLYLKLCDRFYRSSRVFFNVDDLTIHGLGFSAARPLYKRKHDLQSCLSELLDKGIIALGRGQVDSRNLFIKKRRGVFVVTLYEGPRFREPIRHVRRPSQSHADDPLYEPMKAIGFSDEAIAHLLTKYSRPTVERWVRITDAAMHDRPNGFPGFAHSPAAFCRDGIHHNRTPPDWFYAFEKRQRQEQWKRDCGARDMCEVTLRKQYAQERERALQQYVQTDGRVAYQAARATLLNLYRATHPNTCEDESAEAAKRKIEREEFTFLDYESWALERMLKQRAS